MKKRPVLLLLLYWEELVECSGWKLHEYNQRVKLSSMVYIYANEQGVFRSFLSCYCHGMKWNIWASLYIKKNPLQALHSRFVCNTSLCREAQHCWWNQTVFKKHFLTMPLSFLENVNNLDDTHSSKKNASHSCHFPFLTAEITPTVHKTKCDLSAECRQLPQKLYTSIYRHRAATQTSTSGRFLNTDSKSTNNTVLLSFIIFLHGWVMAASLQTALAPFHLMPHRLFPQTCKMSRTKKFLTETNLK